MDPFNPSSTSAPRGRRHRDDEQSSYGKPSQRYRAEPQPRATNENITGSKSAGLRRSAGLFNLKLDVEDSSKPENLGTMGEEVPLPAAAQENIKLTPNISIASSSSSGGKPLIMTPDSTPTRMFVQASTASSRRRNNALSLKRPHPFSSMKRTRQSGFLSRSSASLTDAASPAGQKRLHLTTSDSDRSLACDDFTPDLSFRCAKPVQTAFVSSGLKSKKHVPQSPKPKVPETPCKRPMNDSSMLDKDSSKSIHHHLKPYPTSILDQQHQYPNQQYLQGFPFPGVSDAGSLAYPKPLEEAPSEVAKQSLQFRSASLSERLVSVPSRTSSPITASSPLLEDAESPLGHHPVDRLQRFSIGHIHNTTEELDPPETPTRFGSGGAMVHTSTPLFRYSVGAGRQSSEAITATPGTAVRPRPLPSVLQSADPADSMSVSPPEPLDMNASINVSSSSLSDASAHTYLSPRTPDVDEVFENNGGRNGRRSRGWMPTSNSGESTGINSIIASSSTESQSHSSPRSRRNMRIFDLWHMESHLSPGKRNMNIADDHVQQQYGHSPDADRGQQQEESSPLPPVPPLRVNTPLGRPQLDGSPRTPSHDHSMIVSHIGDLSALDANRTGDSSRLHSIIAAASGNASSIKQQLANHQMRQHPNSHQVPHDEFLAAKFDRVQSAAFGEFSAVFVVANDKQRFAVKRTKRPMMGQRERLRRREEVDILHTLVTPNVETNVVQLVNEWEADDFGYIMTEFCENGDLSRFLADQGRISRLEEWRVWKILVEILKGLSIIHAHDILHLDLKPANIFVTFEGHLKIGDFGMATKDPVPPGFEREGDREYIAPEVLERQQYGKPADVFSVGLMMVEIAANIVLPDNGVHWHRLRSGDLSDAGRLSSGDLTTDTSRASSLESKVPCWAPKFLVDDECLLDKVVSQMLSPQPERRPTVAQLLTMPEMLLVDQRGQAGAVIYEGEFGPEPEADDEISVWQHA